MDEEIKTTRCKFHCESVTSSVGGERAKLFAVTDNGTPENKRFNQASPSGAFEIYISNTKAMGFFKPGKDYYLDVTEAPKPDVA